MDFLDFTNEENLIALAISFIVSVVMLYFLLLNLVFTSISVMFILFVWATSESSYYRMLQLNSELLMFLKKKLGE